MSLSELSLSGEHLDVANGFGVPLAAQSSG
jgi:hypothetical protein